MDKKEMTKRHPITCSVIVLLVIFSLINILGANAVPRTKKSAKKHKQVQAYKPAFILASTEDEAVYSFANEPIPVNDEVVTAKLKRSLVTHNFRHVQSNILQNKAEKLFPIIEPILQAYGIPDDFKYIPLVESGFGEGSSSKGARGPWQFMAGTARTYGLKVGHGIDERMNIRKSTRAACIYIKELYAEFNSWTLTAAAYNNGSIKLEKSIREQNEDNYFHMHLNRETGVYVYNLIAMKAIIQQPQKYGFRKHYQLKYFNPGSPELLAIN